VRLFLYGQISTPHLNTELTLTFLPGSICAERSGLTKMRLIADSILEKVVIVSDCDEPISPGALCREYIVSAGEIQVLTLIIYLVSSHEVISPVLRYLQVDMSI
jgi:cytidine deaminase